jgi:16S rRNA (guanine966-N2)-methyltransferase
MRVIAGTHRGRRIASPPGTTTRPTSDRVREALFSRIEAVYGPFAEDAAALDLFAGSGALGIEALSRGLGHVTFIERERASLAVLRANLDSLALADRSTVLPGDAFRMTQRATLPGGPFALLFVDPPYRIDESEVRQSIERLASHGSLAEGAIIVWEHSSSAVVEWPTGFEDLGARRYGDTTVSMGIARRGETR